MVGISFFLEARTMSATVTMANVWPPRARVAGLRAPGPGLPRHPPRMLEQMTKY